jgi:hypothetical protein
MNKPVFSWTDTRLSLYSMGRSDRMVTRELFDSIMLHLRERLFRLRPDPKVDKVIRNDHLIGYRRDLRVYAEYGKGVSGVEFYQEIVKENRHGGRYDFDKFNKMPKRIQWFFRIEKELLTKLLLSLGLENNTHPTLKTHTARQIVEHHIRTCGHMPPGADPFGDWYPYHGYGNELDRDNRTIQPGQVKYFYDYNGNLKRGTVYKNLNNMWWVVVSEREYNNVASFNLFDYSGEPRRSIERGIKRKHQLMEDAADRYDYSKAEIFRKLLGLEIKAQKEAA